MPFAVGLELCNWNSENHATYLCSKLFSFILTDLKYSQKIIVSSAVQKIQNSCIITGWSNLETRIKSRTAQISPTFRGGGGKGLLAGAVSADGPAVRAQVALQFPEHSK